jgi:hypothetical protein
MKLLIACLVVLSLLVCLPAAACPPATRATFGAGYGSPMAFGAGQDCGVSANFGGGYGAMVAPVAALPVASYGMVNQVGVAAPLYGGYSSVGVSGVPMVNNVTVVHHRPGLLGRIHAARQAFHRGF